MIGRESQNSLYIAELNSPPTIKPGDPLVLDRKNLNVV